MNAAEYLTIDPAHVIIPFITLPPTVFSNVGSTLLSV